MKRVLLILSFLLIAWPASAQNVNNPTVVQFVVSADHANVTSYSLGFFTDSTSLTPISEVNLGKPTPDANNTASVTINTQPLSFANGLYGRVRAIAGTASSLWSDPSNPFNRIPGPPSKAVIK